MDGARIYRRNYPHPELGEVVRFEVVRVSRTTGREHRSADGKTIFMSRDAAVEYAREEGLTLDD